MDSQGSPSRRTATFVDTITFAAPSRRHSRIRRLVASLIESWSSTARAFLNRARSRSPARVLGHPVGHARGEGDASIVARRLGSRQVGCLQPWSPPAGGTSSRVVTLRCCGGGVPSDLPRECSGQTSAVDAPRLVRFGREPDPAGVGGQRPRRRPRAATWNRSPTIFGESGTTRSSGPGFVETLSVRRAPAITVARSRGAAHPHPGEAGLRRRGVARRVRACVSIGKPPRWVSAVTVHGLRGQSVSPPPVSCALTVAALCVLELRTPPEGSGQRPRRRLGAAGAGSAGRSRRDFERRGGCGLVPRAPTGAGGPTQHRGCRRSRRMARRLDDRGGPRPGSPSAWQRGARTSRRYRLGRLCWQADRRWPGVPVLLAGTLLVQRRGRLLNQPCVWTLDTHFMLCDSHCR